MRTVKVKFLGKKSPFIYENVNLRSKKLHWSGNGAIVEMPIEDAEFLMKWSAKDFEIVKEPESEPVEEKKEDIEKEEVDERRAAALVALRNSPKDAPEPKNKGGRPKKILDTGE